MASQSPNQPPFLPPVTQPPFLPALPPAQLHCLPAFLSLGAFVKGSQWLVWRFESDSTLGDALDGLIGEFPYDLEQYVVGRVNDKVPAGKRETIVSVCALGFKGV